MRAFFLFLISTIIVGCSQPGPTGYKYGGNSVGSNVIQTCDEEYFLDKWWDFTTSNAIANTLVPMYKDYCTYTSDDFVFYWNTEEMTGYYDYDWTWNCVSKNVMRAYNEATGDEIDVRVYGKVTSDCYDIKITYGNISINGDLCECLYNGP